MVGAVSDDAGAVNHVPRDVIQFPAIVIPFLLIAIQFPAALTLTRCPLIEGPLPTNLLSGQP